MAYKIGILIPPVTDLYRCITLGAINAFSSDRSYQVHMNNVGVPYLGWDELEGWDGEGVIALIQNPRQQALLEKRGLCAINVSGAYDCAIFPTVVTDNVKVGEMAATHLMGSGLHNFLYYGQRDMLHSLQRRDGFAKVIRKSALRCNELLFASYPDDYKSTSPGRDPRQLRVRHLEHYLSQATLPLGLMAVNDRYAMDVMQACQTLHLQIPNQVAIVGVDDDVMICNVLTPTLSSIRQNGETIGHSAATLLKHVLSGKKVSSLHTLVQPHGLVLRESTNILKSHHPHVNATLRFIRNHVSDNISVKDIIKHVSVSRRTLEKHFKTATGRSMHMEIRQCHIAHAKTLLATTSRSVSEISHLSGYRSILRFMVAFKEETGTTPGQWRKQSEMTIAGSKT